MINSSTVSVTGDVHGEYNPFVHLLHAAGYLDDQHAWAGGSRTLWIMGDLFNNGPASLPVLDLVMRLQREAQAAGGTLACLLGNHEVMMLAAQAQPDAPFPGPHGETFRSHLLATGHVLPSDLDHLTPAHIAWLRALPTMVRLGSYLLVHADCMMYPTYGPTVEAVNAAVSAVLARNDPTQLADLWQAFGVHHAFIDQPGDHHPDDGTTRAQALLTQYGGRQIVHGHSPLYKLTGQDPTTVTAPYIYATTRAVDVDGCLYAGGPGFVWDLPEQPDETQAIQAALDDYRAGTATLVPHAEVMDRLEARINAKLQP